MGELDILVEELRATWTASAADPGGASSLDAEVADFKANRAHIEQAKGVLMQLLGVDADTAFAVLLRYSQDHNVRVRTLADRLVQAAGSRETPSRDTQGPQDLPGLLERLSVRD